MSGGSMEHLYWKVAEARFEESTHLRRALRKHLQKVSEALKAIEWVDSGDSCAGDEDEAIRACFGGTEELQQLLSEARELQVKLSLILDPPKITEVIKSPAKKKTKKK